ncbi:hypothetical protein JZ751_001782 [Albula glossodonta]|uniref:Tubulin-specific chaperone A n=1 Tax=Albula glossodonta TaxID=121402 RepID=A0A8T2PUP2_9TELE|nr:hypothetical protein JZ751_001782 [Albula glossodonta]
MADPRVRQIKIKTGVVKRLAKEEVLYVKEAKQQEEKIERLKAEGGDEYVIKKQMEVLQESRMMIPDCHRRLAVAHMELSQLLVSPHCIQCHWKAHSATLLNTATWRREAILLFECQIVKAGTMSGVQSKYLVTFDGCSRLYSIIKFSSLNCWGLLLT